LADLVLLLDIGTTTISAEIFDIAAQTPLARGNVLNSQSEIGEDIVSRIGFALRGGKNIEKLQKKAAGSVNFLIHRVLGECPARLGDIDRAFCACNSGIYHILLGIDPSPLITPPYKIRQRSEVTVSAGSIDFKLAQKARVTFLPNIGGFVGSDAFCCVLSSGIYSFDKLRAVIDIGTNSEILLGYSGKILAASAAAGPAFEARHIKDGMPYAKGAITGVKIINGRPRLKIAGNIDPKGIAGSGLVEACYQLYRSGFIDRSGRMREKEFVLFCKGRKRITITQADIRKLQLAKAAILSGVRVLLSRHKALSSDIEKVFLTGSFGTGLDVESVIGIGLLPDMDKGKVVYIQNAVIAGLRLWAGNRSIPANVSNLLGQIQHVPLFGRRFEKEYIQALALG